MTAKLDNNKFSLSLYWRCQIFGWSLVSIFWAYTVYTRDNYGAFYTLLNYAVDIFIGIFLTHIYRSFVLRVGTSDLELKRLLFKIVPSVFILAFLYMLLANLKWHLYWTQVRGTDYDLLTSLFEWNPVFITGLRLMSIWLLAYHLYHYYINQIEITSINTQLLLIAKQAQLDNLSAQLNPHFLFNSLNSIKSLVIENPRVARRAIDLLSDILRSSLYEKDKDLIPIKEELLLVKDYIELEKLRFEERLELNIFVDKSIEYFKIPTLSIQLLIENSIKHGIDTKIDGGVISVTIKKENDTILIVVENPGVLNTKIKRIGLGLKNLQERLAIQYKGKADLSLVETSQETVKVTITIPIFKNEKI